jgi:ribosomal protein S18 acetylase RimI-like enzyme
VTIRPYASPSLDTPGDRAAVRELCCEAAYGDIPLESFYPDRALFADLSTRFYLDWEPGSSWVATTAETDGRVVGYLLGAADSRRQRRVQIARVVPVALAGFVLRGGLAKGATWRLLAANLGRLVPRGGSGGGRFDADRYPAHLHLGLDPAQRGKGLGGRLVETFLAQLRAAGVPGVHAVVLAENGRGRRFFARLGFRPLAESAALRRPGQPGEPTKIVYGRPL